MLYKVKTNARLTASVVADKRGVARSLNPAAAVLVTSLAALALLLLSTLSAAPAKAHDDLLSTTPADASALGDAPEDITLKFAAAPVKDTSKLVATADTGEQFALTDVTVSGSTVSAPWPQTAPAGTYKVAWRSVGSDGHPLTGTFSFSYATPGAGPAIPEATTGTPGAGIGVATPAPQASPIAATGPGGIGGNLWILPSVILIFALIAGFIGFRERRKRNRLDRPNT